MNLDSTHIEKWQNKPSNKPDYRGASIIGTHISNLHANLLYKIKSKFGDQSVHIPARKAPSFLLPSPPPPPFPRLEISCRSTRKLMFSGSSLHNLN